MSVHPVALFSFAQLLSAIPTYPTALSLYLPSCSLCLTPCPLYAYSQPVSMFAQLFYPALHRGELKAERKKRHSVILFLTGASSSASPFCTVVITSRVMSKVVSVSRAPVFTSQDIWKPEPVSCRGSRRASIANCMQQDQRHWQDCRSRWSRNCGCCGSRVVMSSCGPPRNIARTCYCRYHRRQPHLDNPVKEEGVVRDPLKRTTYDG